MRQGLILRICIAVIAVLVLGLPVLPAYAAGESVEIHWDWEMSSPQETYFGSASTVYLKASKEGYTSGNCTADLLLRRTGEVVTITLADLDSTANYTANFIPDAVLTDVEHGDQIEIKVYMGNDQIAKRTIYIDDAPPTITTKGTLTLTNDVGNDGVASVGDTITYATGIDGTSDAVIWTVDLSAFGLSATASPDDYIIPLYTFDGACAAVETVTDKAKNTVTGGVNVIGNFKVDTYMPVIVSPGIITLSGDADDDGLVDVGDNITYTKGTLEAGDSDTWRVDLSVWGLSAAAEPGTYAVVTANASPGFVETVRDNGGNLAVGAVSPSSSISNLRVYPEASYLGDRQYIHATLKNTGGFTGDVALVLSINGDVISSDPLVMNAGESQPIEMIIRMDSVGTHTLNLNGASTTFVVEERILPEAPIPPSSVATIPPPPEPELPTVPEEPAPPFSEPSEPQPSQQQTAPEPVNMLLVVVAAIGQSLVVYYLVRYLRKKALYKTGETRVRDA